MDGHVRHDGDTQGNGVPPDLGVGCSSSPPMAASDASSALRLGMERPGSSEVASMQHPILTGHDGGAGRNEDAVAWEKLAAAAEECLSLELSHAAYEALVRLEGSYRRAAALPARSRRRLRSA
jgi:hypothetical protein